jgi:hypothetical protein
MPYHPVARFRSLKPQLNHRALTHARRLEGKDTKCVMQLDMLRYASLDEVMVIKTRSVRWTKHDVLMGQMRNACRILI